MKGDGESVLTTDGRNEKAGERIVGTHDGTVIWLALGVKVGDIKGDTLGRILGFDAMEGNSEGIYEGTIVVVTFVADTLGIIEV